MKYQCSSKYEDSAILDTVFKTTFIDDLVPIHSLIISMHRRKYCITLVYAYMLMKESCSSMPAITKLIHFNSKNSHV